MEVTPEKQNIHTLFSTTNYHIDFYQREYKWDEDEVMRLINDMYYHFEQSYHKYSNLDPTEENVQSHYSWYYLNTYITNKSEGRVFVVDGQQRLTTLTLMLIKLYHLCSEDALNLPSRRDWVASKIAGVGVGGKKRFWIAHEKRDLLMQSLLDGKIPTSDLIDDRITAKHIVENYKLISREFDERFNTNHKLDTFIYYFLCMVVIINLEVAQTDVPMVFEVINDRGISLQPYEILKGKLLGEIDKTEVDQYADIWERSLEKLESVSESEPDAFFRTYLRAHFSQTRKQGVVFDGPYHRAIFGDVCNSALQLKQNANGIKDFLKGPFKYYANLYYEIKMLGDSLDGSIPEFYYSSKLNRMDGQVMLSIAACNVDDPEKGIKLGAVARAFDRAYVMLQLNRAYDSNKFQEMLYTLLPILRSCSASQVENLIDSHVLKEINLRRNTDSSTLLSYGQYKQVGYGDYNTRFLRYYLVRIEEYIATHMGWKMKDTLYNYVCGTGINNAYHIEHILAKNQESRRLFTNNAGDFDEALFENERNRFGGLLLLKGRDNQSSGNESYSEKLRTYFASGPYLAQTLIEEFYKSNTNMKMFIDKTGLRFEAEPEFSKDALERRSLLLYEITKKIWNL